MRWRALDLTGVHLVGAALGGWIAAELATRNTARLASLTLIDPWGLRVDGAPGVDPFASGDEQIGARSVRRSQSRRRLGRAHPRARGRGRALERQDGHREARLAAAAARSACSAKWLHRIDVPTLILWGGGDRLLPPAYGAAWHNAIAGIDAYDHRRARAICRMSEKPSETAAAIANFRARNRDMKIFNFHLMPYADADLDGDRSERRRLGDLFQQPLRPGEGRRAVQPVSRPARERADELGFDGVCVNEHHQTAYGMMPVPGVLAGALSAQDQERASSPSSAARCRW